MAKQSDKMKDVEDMIVKTAEGGLGAVDSGAKYADVAGYRDVISNDEADAMVADVEEDLAVNKSLEAAEKEAVSMGGAQQNRFRALKKRMKATTMTKLRMLAGVYNPMNLRKTQERMQAMGYDICYRTVVRLSKNPYFIQMWQNMLRPLVAGDIARVADVQAAVTAIMVDKNEDAKNRLRAAELMGKFLHAFDNTVNVQGQINVLAGVVTGVPRGAGSDVIEDAVRSCIAKKVEEEG